MDLSRYTGEAIKLVTIDWLIREDQDRISRGHRGAQLPCSDLEGKSSIAGRTPEVGMTGWRARLIV